MQQFLKFTPSMFDFPSEIECGFNILSYKQHSRESTIVDENDCEPGVKTTIVSLTWKIYTLQLIPAVKSNKRFWLCREFNFTVALEP